MNITQEHDAENLLITHDEKLAGRYAKNRQRHERRSEVYVGRVR